MKGHFATKSGKDLMNNVDMDVTEAFRNFGLPSKSDPRQMLVQLSLFAYRSADQLSSLHQPPYAAVPSSKS